jgi:hypothetical protein
MIAALDLLYIVLAISLLFIAIPLTLILWKTYFMLDGVKYILSFAERLVSYGEEIEKIPLTIIEKIKGIK